MDWLIAKDLVEYPEAVSEMEARVAAIRAGSADEAVWLLEHPPLYTAGTSARDSDLLEERFPVYKTGRGGEHTYHGPGQRVAYVMIDLKKRARRRHSGESRNLVDIKHEDPGLRRDDDRAMPDIKDYIWRLEEWIINALARFDIKGERREGRVGIWVATPLGEKKIAAIGVRVRHWITYHGIAINLNPDLSHFGGIVPCGISEYGVTSMHDLWPDTKTAPSMDELDVALKESWSEVF